MSLNEDKFRSAVQESPAVKSIAKKELACLNITFGIAIAITVKASHPLLGKKSRD